jgi:hypothetical protein
VAGQSQYQHESQITIASFNKQIQKYNAFCLAVVPIITLVQKTHVTRTTDRRNKTNIPAITRFIHEKNKYPSDNALYP